MITLFEDLSDEKKAKLIEAFDRFKKLELEVEAIKQASKRTSPFPGTLNGLLVASNPTVGIHLYRDVFTEKHQEELREAGRKAHEAAELFALAVSQNAEEFVREINRLDTDFREAGFGLESFNETIRLDMQKLVNAITKVKVEHPKRKIPYPKKYKRNRWS